jgi:hypothetical protein
MDSCFVSLIARAFSDSHLIVVLRSGVEEGWQFTDTGPPHAYGYKGIRFLSSTTPQSECISVAGGRESAAQILSWAEMACWAGDRWYHDVDTEAVTLFVRPLS